MIHQTLKLDATTYNNLIGVCKSEERWDVALHILHVMRRQLTQPDVIGYSAAIGAYSGNTRRWSQALLLFAELLEGGSTLDTIAYNAAMDACRERDTWSLALHLFRHLQCEGGLQADVVSCNTLGASFAASRQ